MAQGKLHTYISKLHLQERIQGLKIAIYEQGASEHEREQETNCRIPHLQVHLQNPARYIYIYRIPHAASIKTHKTLTNHGQETKGINRYI